VNPACDKAPRSEQAALPARIVAALRSAIGDPPVALHEPTFRGNEWKYVKQCLDTTFVSSVGEFVDQFELDLARFTGASYAVATVSGTAALHVALRLAGVRAGDEVLTPALTFVATTNAISYCNAVPHFVDSEERTLGVDPRALRDYLSEIAEVRGGVCVNRRTGRALRALVPMHTFGHPVDVEGLLAVSRDFGIDIVEDAAESLGSLYHGVHTGTFGRLGILSFNGNKIVTTGGGGAILTNDRDLAKHAKHLTTTAKLPHAWEFRHDEIGYNYRMPNLNAALGCAQLEQLPQLIAAKRRLFERYQQVFADIAGARLVAEPVGCRSNYWLQTLLLEAPSIDDRDASLAVANGEGFMMRPAWTLNHRLPAFSDCPSMPLPVAESLANRILSLPSSAHLSVREST
jgi:perosamine synthetase